MSSCANGFKFTCDMCDKVEIMTINSLPEYWDHFYFCFEKDNKVSTHWDLCNTCNPNSRSNKDFFKRFFKVIKVLK